MRLGGHRRHVPIADQLGVSDPQPLGREGKFGTGDERNKITVNIMWGDQGVAYHVRSAKALNPPGAYPAYARHELPSLYAQQREFSTEASIGEVIEVVERDLKRAGR